MGARAQLIDARALNFFSHLLPRLGSFAEPKLGHGGGQEVTGKDFWEGEKKKKKRCRENGDEEHEGGKSGG